MSSSKSNSFQWTYNIDIVDHFSEQILRVKNGGTNIPAILVGNKIDLAERRKVTPEEAQQKARSWSILYIETSAKTKFNVDKVKKTRSNLLFSLNRFVSSYTKVFCELMRIVRPFKNPVRDPGPPPSGGTKVKPTKQKKEKKCVIL